MDEVGVRFLVSNLPTVIYYFNYEGYKKKLGKTRLPVNTDSDKNLSVSTI